MSAPIRVVLADDDALVREGIASILDGQHDIEVVGRASDGREAVELCRTIEPEVALLDIRMPNLDGLGAVPRIRAVAPNTAVVMLTTFDAGTNIDEALMLGAVGFVVKSASFEQLVSAVRGAASGQLALGSEATRHVVQGYLASRRAPDPADLLRIEDLTAREREVFALVATGVSNGEIAARLHVSEHTVKTHVSHILTKTDCSDRTRLAALAHRTLG